MNISTACPNCGGALDIAEQAARVVCPFCGTHYEVDFSGAAPEFRKSAPPDVFVPQDADIISPPVSGTEAGNSYPPPQPNNFSAFPGQPYNLPPFVAQEAGRLVGTRLWFALAVAAIIIFCLSCVCLLAVVRFVFGT